MAAIQLVSARPLTEYLSDSLPFAAPEMIQESQNMPRPQTFRPTTPVTISQQMDFLEESDMKGCSPTPPTIPFQIEPPSFAPPFSHSVAQTVGLAIPASQRAAITPLVGKSLNMTVHEVKLGSPAANEALIRILYTGICGSDVCFSTGPEPGYPTFNNIAGHEGIGEVVACHDATLVNQIVGIRYLGATCGICSYCLGGLPTSCPEQLNIPKQAPGTFQEYAIVPVSCLVPLPNQIVRNTPHLASLCAALCSGSAALMALRAARPSPGSIVVVSGVAGSIGHMVGAMALHIFGARVIGVDHGWKNEILATKHDNEFADTLLDAPSSTEGKDWATFIASLIRSCSQLRHAQGTARAADCLIICANKESAFKNMEDYVCDGGRIVCSGVPRGLSLSISIHALVERNLCLTGTLMGGHEASLEVMDYISRMLVRPLITEKALDDIPRSMEDLANGKTIGKTVIRMTDNEASN
ncbi:hypothetical protein NM208_g791 [Fusarium decemcellulare]|uniref:Uncharacterized protein n=1 Tax=Fusarium decemcellulare TaxID=57161 RepID=A0ACC1SYK6_9HYPO|nr:hypothetical protein NM208_g791 [Fusarium decemcellulare]